jgi:hypothetical protein
MNAIGHTLSPANPSFQKNSITLKGRLKKFIRQQRINNPRGCRRMKKSVGHYYGLDFWSKGLSFVTYRKKK